jgi:hypothetical protein
MVPSRRRSAASQEWDALWLPQPVRFSFCHSGAVLKYPDAAEIVMEIVSWDVTVSARGFGVLQRLFPEHVQFSARSLPPLLLLPLSLSSAPATHVARPLLITLRPGMPCLTRVATMLVTMLLLVYDDTPANAHK